MHNLNRPSVHHLVNLATQFGGQVNWSYSGKTRMYRVEYVAGENRVEASGENFLSTCYAVLKLIDKQNLCPVVKTNPGKILGRYHE